ncbi:hypothetical protein QP028_08645 [Corynebacterium suedekumii]|nr:hypothetical protein QP028_08645 [Corynebacterium suedekumii]
MLAQLIAVAVAGGDEVVLACPEGNLPDIVDPAVHHVPVPLSRLGRSRGRLGRLAAIAGLPVSWWRTARILRIAARDADAVILNSTFGLPAVGLAFPGHTWPRGAAAAAPPSPGSSTTPSIRRSRSGGAAGNPCDHAGRRGLGGHRRLRPQARTPGRVPSQRGPDPCHPDWRHDHGSGPARRGHPRGARGVGSGHDVLLEAVARVPEVQLEIAGTAFPDPRTGNGSCANAPLSRISPAGSDSSATPTRPRCSPLGSHRLGVDLPGGGAPRCA